MQGVSLLSRLLLLTVQRPQDTPHPMPEHSTATPDASGYSFGFCGLRLADHASELPNHDATHLEQATASDAAVRDSTTNHKLARQM